MPILQHPAAKLSLSNPGSPPGQLCSSRARRASSHRPRRRSGFKATIPCSHVLSNWSIPGYGVYISWATSQRVTFGKPCGVLSFSSFLSRAFRYLHIGNRQFFFACLQGCLEGWGIKIGVAFTMRSICNDVLVLTDYARGWSLGRPPPPKKGA